MPEFKYHDINRLSTEDVFKRLETGDGGLTSDEARRRLKQFGPNVLAEPDRYSVVRGLTCQFTHFLAVLLWIAVGLSFAADFMRPGEGMATLGWAILGVIVINALFAFVQEYKAERAVQALRRLLPDKAWVTREGQSLQVARSEIVPGDVLLLEEGERVPADARIIEAMGLRVDNAALTGESRPKRRIAEATDEGHWLDFPNLVFAGTTVISGHGRAAVFASGMRTEFGKIANLTTTVETSLSPLQKEIIKVARIIAAISLAMGATFFAIGVWTGLSFWISAIFGIGIIIANVPEGLLPTVTLALAMSSQRMAKRNALIKHLPSVETLGCTTVICTDKTGTLTENRMKVDRFYADGLVIESREGCFFTRGRLVSTGEAERWRAFFDALLHCHNAKRVRRSDGRSVVTGDPTEVALVEFTVEHGLAHRPPLRRMGELAFDADRKRMSTLHWSEGKLIAFTKGAPESILPLCTRIHRQDRATEMTSDERGKVLAKSRSFAQQAYRVLAVAMRDVAHQPEHIEVETIENDLTFLGLVAMMDPPHREVPDAIAKCKRAGVRVIMITGDHPLTALAIARKIDLVPSQTAQPPTGFVPVIEGSQLDRISGDHLRQLLTPSRSGEPDPIFARMAPRHKMRIVSTLKDMGEVVAVTGDGVNDAPALKKADIGIAMGVAGTDVARETAHMILLDDNFATIVNAIEEGRAVYANMRKFVTYVLTHTTPEVVPYLAYGLFSVPPALTIPQILAVDLGTDILPALALGTETPHAGIMETPPRQRTQRLLNLPLLLRSYVFLGLTEATIAMSAFFLFLSTHGWTMGQPLDWSSSLYRQATAITLAAIVMTQVANVFACRSERTSIFQLGFFSNPQVIWGIAVELLLLLLLVYTPLGNTLFGTDPLPVWIFGPLALGALVLLFAEEGRKMVENRLYHKHPIGTAQ